MELSGSNFKMKKFNRPIKVANIIEEGRVGGPQKRIALVASKISKEIDTTVIIPKENSAEFQTLCKKLNVKYLISPLIPIKRDIFSMFSYLAFFPYEVFKLSRLLKKNNFDIAHISGGSWQYKGALAAKLAKVKILWHLNDTYVPIFFKILFKLISPIANGYIFSAFRAKKYYNKYINLKKPKFVIAPPVDTTIFNPSKNYKLNKKKILNQKKLTVIGTIANINKIKGLETFIKAGEILNQNIKNLHFQVVGKVFENQKKYFNSLENLCKKKKFFNIDFIKNCSDVRPYLKRFDIFTISSLSETGPMTLWEAMSMEKAIVSTNVGDVRMFLKNNINSYIVDVGDYKEFAKKINKLITRPRLRRNFGKKVRCIVKNKLDLRVCANLHAKAYRTIVNSD